MHLKNFQFYFDLVFNGYDNDLLSDFLGNEELLSNGFEYLPEYDYYLKDEMLVDQAEPIFAMTIVNREDFLANKFRLKKQLLLDEIRVISNFSDVDNKKNFFTTILNEFYIVYKKLLETQLIHQEIIIENFRNLLNDLKLLFKDEITNHKLFAKLESLEKSSYGTFFGLKSFLKKSFLNDLYDLCLDLFLIDDEVVSESDFIEVFTALKPSQNIKIKFNEKNYPIVYFLESIQPFFDNFTFTAIEQSKNFYNKQNKLLTATDLSSTKSRNKNTSGQIISKIDSAINLLKSKHLI